MSEIRTALDRVLVRCEAAWTPAVERHVTGAGEDPEGWLPSAAGLLRASWSEGGRDCAVAAVAILEYALDVGERRDPRRPRWVLHLWLAERTLALRFQDHRLSHDVHHYLAAQTQGRSADDPVAVAATFPEEPSPRHFEPPRPSHPHAVRLAEGLPADDLVRPCLLARLAQSAFFRLESGDMSALEDAGRWADAAFAGITADHLEAGLVSCTAVHAALARFRDRPSDARGVQLALSAGRSALKAVEHSRRHGTRPVDDEAASAHLMFSLALTASLPLNLDEEIVDEAIAQLEAFRACAPPDDNGAYAGNMPALLGARAVLTGSHADLRRADELWAALQRDLPPDHPLMPHLADKRAACAKMEQMLKRLPFNGARLFKLVGPMLGPLLSGVQLPPIRMYVPPGRPGVRSPGPGPEDFAPFMGGPRPASADAGPGRTGAATVVWPPGPPLDAGPAEPASAADLDGLPPDAAAVRSALLGTGVSDPRRLALAVDQLKTVLAGPLPDGRRGFVAGVLVQLLAAQFTFSEDPEDLERVVRCGDEHLALLPPTSARYIELLCAVEMHRHAHGTLHQDEATVARACDALAWAVGRLPEMSASWIGCVIPYAHALAGVSWLRRDGVGTQEAVRLIELAERGLEALPGRPEYSPELAELRKQLRPALAAVADLVRRAHDDVTWYRHGDEEPVSWTPAGDRVLPPRARFEMARTALGEAVERRDWALATDAAEAALESLPLVVSQALHRDDRQAVLRTALLGRRYPAPAGPRRASDLPDRLAGTSLARTACAVALAAGRTEQAAALLEQGRAVLMAQDLQARSDVSDLDAVHPQEAREFTALARRLRETESDTDAETAGAPTGPGDAARIREQHEVAEEWQRLLARIRGLDGFEHFLLPPSAEQMRREAKEGPIVLINIDLLRSDALVVTAKGIELVRLDATEGRLAHTARRFLTAVSVGAGESRAQRKEAAATVFDTLEWLWDTIAEPVLEAAGLTRPIPDGTPRDAIPRLWWSASGPLAHLPLHAAGHHRAAALGDGRSVLDRVASSYTPSIRALRHARQARAAGGGAGPFLAVRRPTGAGGRDGASVAEVAAMARTLGGLRTVQGDEATVGRVLAELSSAATVHFACHGFSDAEDPSRSHLELADGRLGVLDVARGHLPHAQLAVLLACHTTRTDLLPDEAVHLTSAFQTAGYPQVVGALWEATDLVSVRLTEHLYRALRTYGGGLDVTDTARAVHGIVRELRARHAESPRVWAPYVHTGR
ncbi:CHAT domain-containing protein [Streptomyces europaeiscabiei]|uniref:CHAT domain-containing protein n=1 Tax=Streptomyces europaeiscabiei TaxID=146819 RepID=UPI0029A5025D|nr:CHAT domain-containing protein [Streptomyces europaeiscabiei]MDX2528101.1 CHAT domain-containing protein [Streptomyces europaeiscabiei]